jgi:hypothetical protein
VRMRSKEKYVRVCVACQTKRNGGSSSGVRGVDGALGGGPACDDEVLVRVVLEY